MIFICNPCYNQQVKNSVKGEKLNKVLEQPDNTGEPLEENTYA